MVTESAKAKVTGAPKMPHMHHKVRQATCHIAKWGAL